MAEVIVDCETIGLKHTMQFVVAEYGYQCHQCAVCGKRDDIIEDSQP